MNFFMIDAIEVANNSLFCTHLVGGKAAPDHDEPTAMRHRTGFKAGARRASHPPQTITTEKIILRLTTSDDLSPVLTAPV